ncbi:hypothetical protein ACFQRK_05420 [Parapedobacter sp. GCM10030251]|uniref:hypothetical protein n=1 Tax=Parapedobacter sp. GCM10030251 TaxID=3273419 RepID=UPI00361824F9
MEKIHLLWTGGWDSTYRILQLANKPVSIQPYYLLECTRKSKDFELRAIDIITKDIRQHPETKCVISELISIKIEDIVKNPEITDAYNEILKTNFFGSQYDWLARFAVTVKNLELAIHEDDKASSIIKKYGSLIKKQDELIGDYYVLNQDVSTESLIKVFGHYRFPILDANKLAMKRWAEEMNYIDIMNKTWFCHLPKNNKPCGICNPCMYTIEEGLEYRFSKGALRRYHVDKAARPIKNTFFYKVVKKIISL